MLVVNLFAFYYRDYITRFINLSFIVISLRLDRAIACESGN